MMVAAGTWALALVRRVPRWAWAAIGLALALWGLWSWHRDAVADARLLGRQEQAAADDVAYRAAVDKATALQAALVKAVAARAAAITERVRDDQDRADADVDRAVADKRMRHAAREADRRRAGEGGANALPDAAGGDREAYCAASGWVPFGRALSMAADAEKDAGQARACAAWVTEQAAAWPDD